MFKKLVGLFTVLLFAVFGLAGTAVAAPRGHDGHGESELSIKYAYVDHGKLLVKVKEVGLEHRQDVYIKGKAFAKVKFACVKNHRVKSVDKTFDKVYSYNAITDADHGKAKGTLVFKAPTGDCDNEGYPVTLKVKWFAVKVFDTKTHSSDSLYGPWVWKADYGHGHGYDRSAA